MASPRPIRAEMIPVFAAYPELNSSAFSVPLKRASRVSSRSCSSMVPETRREAPLPTPNATPMTAALLSAAWSASPR